MTLRIRANNDLAKRPGVPVIEIPGLGVFSGQASEGVYENHKLCLDTSGERIVYSITPDPDGNYSPTTVQAYLHAIGHIRRTLSESLSKSLPHLRKRLRSYRTHSADIPDEADISDERLQRAINIEWIQVQLNAAFVVIGNIASLIETYVLEIHVDHQGKVVDVRFDG